MSAVNGMKKKLAAAFRWKTINSFNLEFDNGSFFTITGYSQDEFFNNKLNYLSIPDLICRVYLP